MAVRQSTTTITTVNPQAVCYTQCRTEVFLEVSDLVSQGRLKTRF